MKNPPRRYSSEAKTVWREILAEWELANSDFLVLGQMCESLMLLRVAEADIEKNGLTIHSGKALKANPAITAVKVARAQLLSSWKLLNLVTPEEKAKLGRPPSGKRARVQPLWLQRKSG